MSRSGMSQDLFAMIQVRNNQRKEKADAMFADMEVRSSSRVAVYIRVCCSDNHTRKPCYNVSCDMLESARSLVYIHVVYIAAGYIPRNFPTSFRCWEIQFTERPSCRPAEIISSYTH